MIWLRFAPYGIIGVLALLCWHFDARAVAEADGRRQDHAAYVSAQAAAQAIAQAAITHQQAVYQAQAQETEHEYQQQLADAHAGADRYIGDHRVPVELRAGPAQSAPSAAAPAGTTGGTSVPASLPADAVVVSADDVQACTAVTTYALAAHEWAMGLGK